MLPAGVLATAYSPKTVLTLGVAVWSVAQILSPAAAHVNLSTLVRSSCVVWVGDNGVGGWYIYVNV